jgi:hypothetical protein
MPGTGVLTLLQKVLFLKKKKKGFSVHSRKAYLESSIDFSPSCLNYAPFHNCHRAYASFFVRCAICFGAIIMMVLIDEANI